MCTCLCVYAQCNNCTCITLNFTYEGVYSRFPNYHIAFLHTDSDSDAWGSLNIKTWSYQFRIPIIKIRRYQDRLIFIMEIPISGKTVFLYWDGDLVPTYKVQRVYVNTSLWINDSFNWNECSDIFSLSVEYMYRTMIHDYVIKWRHFPRYLPFVRGIHRSPVNSSHKGQWRGTLMFSLICAWINGWVNNREDAALRRHRAHYDVIVMIEHEI